MHCMQHRWGGGRGYIIIVQQTTPTFHSRDVYGGHKQFIPCNIWVDITKSLKTMFISPQKLPGQSFKKDSEKSTPLSYIRKYSNCFGLQIYVNFHIICQNIYQDSQSLHNNNRRKLNDLPPNDNLKCSQINVNQLTVFQQIASKRNAMQ